MIKDQRNISKYFITFSGLLILIISYLGYKSPVLGYELSIYNSTPLIIWVLYVIVLLFLYFVSIFMIDDRTSKNTIYFLMIVSLTAHLVFLTLPYIRGYYTWGGDHVSHSFIVKNLLLNGNIELTNVYPISHILATILVLFTNINYNIIVNIFSALFSIFFILFLFCLGKLCISDQRAQIICFITSTGVFITGYQIKFMPNGFSVLYLPFTLYLFFRSILHNKKEDWILLLLNIYLLLKFHPISSLYLNIFFVISIGVYFLYNKQDNKIFRPNIIKNVTIIFTINIALFVIEFLMFTKRFYANLRLSFLEYMGYIQNTMRQNIDEKLAKMGFTIINVIDYVIRINGQHFILGFSSLLCFILLLQNKLHLTRTRKYLLYVLLGGIFLFGALYSLSMLGVVPGGSVIKLTRLLPYSMITTPIFAGIILAYYSSNRVNKTVIIIILLSSSMFSMINIFPSPITYSPNHLTMESELISCTYIKNYKISEYNSMVLLDGPQRIFTGMINETSLSNLNLKNFILAPDHFGYEKNNTLSSLQKESFYLYYTEMDYLVYNTVYSPVGRYLYDDFEKLYNDIYVNNCYSNDNIHFMLIN